MRMPPTWTDQGLSRGPVVLFWRSGEQRRVLVEPDWGNLKDYFARLLTHFPGGRTHFRHACAALGDLSEPGGLVVVQTHDHNGSEHMIGLARPYQRADIRTTDVPVLLMLEVALRCGAPLLFRSAVEANGFAAHLDGSRPKPTPWRTYVGEVGVRSAVTALVEALSRGRSSDDPPRTELERALTRVVYARRAAA